MSRTAHHIRSRRAPRLPYGARPWRVVDLTVPRYGRRELGDAAREGRRPFPRYVRVRVAVYAYPRSGDDRALTVAATLAERRERARLRAATDRIRGLVYAPGGPLRLRGAERVDVPPARHRRSVLWHA
ncbi:hypothetical protein ACIQUQ_18830 [Streptomyces sp. NPDC101118]|uniref:hypothetical protein n=1 Tax=Streptomyces sp. NPDC101118 TaxID=3366109 RepID=UPI00382ECE03